MGYRSAIISRRRSAPAAGVPIAPRPNKYRALATTVDGLRFASKAEARRYVVLTVRVKAGLIRCLELQPAFELSVGGIVIGRYVADFAYVDLREPVPRRVYEDVKGVRTPLYKWKRKHVQAQYGIEVKEIP